MLAFSLGFNFGYTLYAYMHNIVTTPHKFSHFI